MAYALRTIEPGHYGYPTVTSVIVFDKKSERDSCLRFIRRNAREWDEFRRRNPHSIVPSGFCWYPDTTAEALPMADARREIAGREPYFEHDGWSYAYNFTPCTVYSDKTW